MTSTLRDYLAARLGRRVTAEEIGSVVGASTSTIKRRLTEGFPAEDVITAAREFGISPVEALVALGYLTADEVRAFEAGRAGLAGFSDLDLAHEIVRRTAAGSASGLMLAPLDGQHPATRGVDADDYVLAAMDRDDSEEMEAQQYEP